MNIPDTTRAQASDLLDFIDASPSPWHAAQTCESRLTAAGFSQLHEHERWTLKAGGRHYVVRGGASIIAFIVGHRPAAETGLRLIGAHTDSPGLRLKPKPAEDAAGMVRLGVEVYGGPILATFADRDLSLAGRVNVRTPGGFTSRLVRFTEPLLRLPNLAIHMNREVNENGLKFNKQTELPLLLGLSEDGTKAEARFRQPIANALGVEPGDLLTWELNAYDTQKGTLWGVDREFVANSQLDNLASCHAALSALLATPCRYLYLRFLRPRRGGQRECRRRRRQLRFRCRLPTGRQRRAGQRRPAPYAGAELLHQR